jgi:hypothetical protein
VSRRTTFPPTVAVSLLVAGEVVGDCAHWLGKKGAEMSRRHKMDSDLMFATMPIQCGPIITQNRSLQKIGCEISEGRRSGRP